MPPKGARQTSRKRSSAWALTPLALVIYASAATVALALELQVPVPAPWWAVVPPLIYALIAVIGVRRRSMGRVLAAVSVLCAVHALLLVGTAVAISYVTPGAPAPFLASTLSALLVVCVPFVLAPFRPREVLRPRPARGTAVTAQSASGPAQRRISGSSPLLSSPAPAAPSGTWPAPSRSPQAAVPPPAARPAPVPSAAVFAPPPRPTPVASPPPPARPEPPRVVPPPPPPSPRPVEPTPVSVPISSGAESMEEVIRISFERVAEQLPTEIFTLPREGVGARLIEAGFLLIPERLVRPQLAEGYVQVGWPTVAEQFPREVLAMSHEDIARRLPNGNLVLPLDEVIRQVPPGMFAVPAPTLDVRALEEFPPPFQPSLPPPEPTPSPASNEEPSTPTEPEATVAPPAYEPEPVTPEPEPAADEPAAYQPEPTGYEPVPAAYEPELETPGYEPAPLPYEPSPVMLEREPAVAEPEPSHPEPPSPAWDPEPRAIEPRLRAPEPAPSAPEQVSDDVSRAADARRMAALLGPLLSPVTTERCERPGATLLTLAPPALTGPMVADVAVRVLPFLTDPRLPEPALQATVRGAAMTVVVTPQAGAPSSALAAATTTGASLALLERLCLRAAAVPVGHGRASTPLAANATDVEFEETAPEPTVRAVADSLQAFGPVTPTVLRDPDGALVVYLFLPRGLAPRTLGGFARDVHRALADSPAGALASVIFRVGTRRLLLRAVDGARGTVLVAGGGPVDRPGMARLELERAATRLGQL